MFYICDSVSVLWIGKSDNRFAFIFEKIYMCDDLQNTFAKTIFILVPILCEYL